MDIFARAFIATVIILVSWGVYQLYNRVLQFRAPSMLAELGIMKHSLSFTLVYFTTPNCIPCKTIQRPAIQKLSQILGNAIQVVEIDATEKPGLASHWGVMSVPTTFLFDPKGQLRHINHGVTHTEKLLMQIHE